MLQCFPIIGSAIAELEQWEAGYHILRWSPVPVSVHESDTMDTSQVRVSALFFGVYTLLSILAAGTKKFFFFSLFFLATV